MRRSAYWTLVPLGLSTATILAACAGEDFSAAQTSAGSAGSTGGSKAGTGAAGGAASGSGGVASGGAGGSATGKGGGAGAIGSAGTAGVAGPPCKSDADCNGASTNRCLGRSVCSTSPGGAFCVVTGGAVDSDDHNLCTKDACDPLTGDVTHEPIALNDDDPCTVDTCDPGVGVAHTQKGGDCDGCKTAADCNDDLPCTDDTCGADGKCASTKSAPTKACRDEDECVGPGFCDGSGSCKPGAPKSLADDDLCTIDRCVGGKIVHDPPAQNPELCAETTCDKKTGVTTTRSRADDNTKCTDDTCDPNTGNVSHTPVETLSDNEPCTKDACDPVTGAISHTTIIGCTGCTVATDCDDQSDCTTDTCTAGICAHVNRAAGDSCENGVTCDGAEVCDANGKCLPGVPLVVDDGDACTVDSCVEPGGVKHVAVEIDDKNRCTTDRCDKEIGVVHEDIAGCASCSKDADCGTVSPTLCQQISCVEGVCKKQPAPVGASCSLIASACASCDGNGTCNIYDGGPQACIGRCGTLTLACGSVSCKGCAFGYECALSDNTCVKIAP